MNLASRLEAMCKQYGVDILISGEMYKRVEADFLARPIDRVVAVGKTLATDIFELVGERAGTPPEFERRCTEFAAAVDAYRRRDFDGALRLVLAYEAEYGPDVAAAKYVARCRQLLADPPPGDWACAVVLTSK